MHYSVQDIGLLLKAARKKNHLSQRELSDLIHVPQSHISKIENGKVDLQTSSLIELSRALGLEVMLVPQALVAAVNAMQKGDKKGNQEQIPMYRLENEDEDD